jgi:hypothetical protein
MVRFLREAGAGAEDVERIAHLNAERLLGLGTAPPSP